MSQRSANALTVEDFVRCPLWRFTDADEKAFDETVIVPIERFPVADLCGVIVGTPVRLANGVEAPAMLGNIDAQSAERTKQFLSLSIARNGEWRHLARYFDHDRDSHGPVALADFLGLRVQDVFPIRYDIRRFAFGDARALSGAIHAEPATRLNEDQIADLAVRP